MSLQKRSYGDSWRMIRNLPPLRRLGDCLGMLAIKHEILSERYMPSLNAHSSLVYRFTISPTPKTDLTRYLEKVTLILIESKNVTRSEEHTSELQSLMRISSAVICLKKKKENNHTKEHRI